MAKWTILYDDGYISKDSKGYSELDLSWLPSDILAVQSPDGITCEIENGNRSTEYHTGNQEDVATSSLAWWANVSTTWQAAYDAEQAAIAEAEAAAGEAAVEGETPV